MLAHRPSPLVSLIHYPESDGLPMSDNTKQFQWIYLLFGNLAAMFRNRLDVFVCGNQFWYPVEGHPEINASPDVYVVFGRPKGHRTSYKQWEEGNLPMTVVFEILSPGNNYPEMDDKHDFYEEHGVEEYYVYDPDRNWLKVFLRHGEVLRRVRPLKGYVSPRLGIRFDLSAPEMVVYGPEDQRFVTFEELADVREQESLRADDEKQRADDEKQRADDEKQRADDEKQRADDEKQRAARLAELSRKVRRGQASAEELQELEGLEEQSLPPSP